VIITRTPFRISFFGGGTDYPEWIAKHGGSILGCGINKYCYISLRYLPPFFSHRYRVVYSISETVSKSSQIRHPAVKAVCSRYFADRGVEVHHDGDLPARSGMGSSSSFAVGLLHASHALLGQMTSRMTLAKEAIHLEQNILRETVGSQDQVLASYGNLNYIRVASTGEILVKPLTLNTSRIEELLSHCMLFFTGTVRTSSTIAQSYVANISAKEKYFLQLPSMVTEACSLLTRKKFDAASFGRLLHEAWKVKRGVSQNISSSRIDHLYETALRSGAWGGKILGAGGGGFMLFFAPPDRQKHIRKALQALLEIPFEIDRLGSQVIFYDPEVDYRKTDLQRRVKNFNKERDLTRDSWK
jgi:D-glycero-alpha-D-manno-heptose-7-phosphate kinase